MQHAFRQILGGALSVRTPEIETSTPLNLFGLIVYCSTKVISWPTDPRIQFVWKSCFGCILARQRNITDWIWSEHNFVLPASWLWQWRKPVNAAATTTFFQNRQTAITEVISRSWLPCTTFGSWSLGISSKWKHINPLTVSFCLRCVCVKTVITYDIIQLCRGRTGLIPGVGQRSSRCQTRISGRDAFLTYLQFRFEQSVFPAVPCFQFAVVLRFEPDQPTIRATCSSPCTKATQENRRRQDLHPSSSHKNLSSVCVCVFGAGMTLWCGLMMFDGQPSYYPATQMSVLQLARPAHAHCLSLPLRWKNCISLFRSPTPAAQHLGNLGPISLSKGRHMLLRDPGVVEVAYFQRLDEIKGRSKVVKNRCMAETHFLQSQWLAFFWFFWGSHSLHTCTIIQNHSPQLPDLRHVTSRGRNASIRQ